MKTRMRGNDQTHSRNGCLLLAANKHGMILTRWLPHGDKKTGITESVLGKRERGDPNIRDLRSRYAYSDIVKVSEDSEYFYLFYNEDMMLAIYKPGFLLGTAEDFREFCKSFIQ